MLPPNTKVLCQNCAVETWHEVKHVESVIRDRPGLKFQDEYQLIRCCGCDAVSLRHHSLVISEDGPETIYDIIYPPRTARKRPDWIDDIEQIDPALASILDEVCTAIDGNAPRLTAMGVRSVFEHVMLDKVGDCGSFEGNLNAFEDAKYISGTQKDILKKVIDLGSATIHRGYLPTDSDIGATIGVMELVVKTIYIDSPALQRIQLPPRPPRKIKNKALVPANTSTEVESERVSQHPIKQLSPSTDSLKDKT